MIVRQRNINKKATEVRLSLAFGTPDIKAWLKEDLQLLASILTQEQARHVPLTEPDTRQALERHRFALLGAKWAQQLSGWVWAQWVAQGYLVESGTKEDTFFLTSKAIDLVRWKAPSPDDEDDV